MYFMPAFDFLSILTGMFHNGTSGLIQLLLVVFFIGMLSAAMSVKFFEWLAERHFGMIVLSLPLVITILLTFGVLGLHLGMILQDTRYALIFVFGLSGVMFFVQVLGIAFIAVIERIRIANVLFGLSILMIIFALIVYNLFYGSIIWKGIISIGFLLLMVQCSGWLTTRKHVLPSENHIKGLIILSLFLPLIIFIVCVLIQLV
jgi:hypothetical protein